VSQIGSFLKIKSKQLITSIKHFPRIKNCLLFWVVCKTTSFYNHAPRKIVEYPSWVTVDEDDPRVREKYIDYDANGNQLEIQEKVGEEMI